MSELPSVPDGVIIVGDGTPEISIPAEYENVVGKHVTIRVAGNNYLFEKTPHNTLIYVGFDVAVDSDDDEPEPFDPAEYR